LVNENQRSGKNFQWTGGDITSVRTSLIESKRLSVGLRYIAFVAAAKSFRMGQAPLSKTQKEANRREQVKRYSSKSDVRMRMRRYAEARRSELRPNRLTASGKVLVALKPVVYINKAEQTI